ncbi:MAG TPA: outer membrane beta-barrel protein [Kofleriaceae bacterium]|nr:outer membrane beta-barrel protein [Kofleriaceae bacterium]
MLNGAAVAEPSPSGAAAPDDASYAVGVRVGGYGFRRDNDSETQAWNLCRMNGLGVFADRALRGPWFLEAGLDTYMSIGQGESTDLPLDRQSVLISLAAGARVQVAPWLRGFAQIGAGVELARLSVPYGDSTIRDTKEMPDGFLGFGGDIRLGRKTYIGAEIRMLVMGNFDYDPARLQMSNQWVAPPDAKDVFAASPDLAAQAQFFLRRDL